MSSYTRSISLLSTLARQLEPGVPTHLRLPSRRGRSRDAADEDIEHGFLRMHVSRRNRGDFSSSSGLLRNPTSRRERGEVTRINCDLSFTDEMGFAAELVMHGDDGAVDVADQAVAQHHIGNLPIAA